jgi:pantoate--beta-alanine ligase
MVRDLNFPIKIVPVPTVREPDGLALSSRNQRLTAEERRAAPILFQSLRTGQGLIASGERDAAKVKAAALAVIDREPLVKLEYFEAVDEQMRPVDQIQSDVRLAVAAWLGSTRLIDNVLCRVA